MDFFKMNFSTLFLNKHGRIVFDNIKDKIVQEKSSSYNDDYIEVVFKVAYFDFWGLKKYEIENIIKDFVHLKINYEDIKSLHNNSIKEIQEYLQSSIDETLINKK